MAQSAFGLPSLLDPSIASDQVALERQMALAQALRKQSTMPLDTANRTVGGMGYRISPLEGVAKLVQGISASNMEGQSDKERVALEQKTLAAWASALRGRDPLARSSSPTAESIGPVPTVGVTSGDISKQSLPPNREGGLSAQPPAIVRAGGDQVSNAVPRPSTQGSLPEAQPDISRLLVPRQAPAMEDLLRGAAIEHFGGQAMASAYAKNFEPVQKVRELEAMGIDPRKMGAAEYAKALREGRMDVAPGNTIYNPATGAQEFSAPEKTPPEVRQLSETIRAAGLDPASPEGQALFKQLASKQVTHQPANTVNVSTEKGYAGEMAQMLAKQDAGLIDLAKGAPEQITNARNVKQLLDANPITGTAANQRLALEKVFTTAGLVDGKRVANTETLVGMLAKSTLDAIKSSGLGSGQGFTDKDREFLEKARSGNITINASTLRTLAELNERSGMATIDKANHVIRKLRSNPNMGGVGSAMDEIAAPSAGPRVVDW